MTTPQEHFRRARRMQQQQQQQTEQSAHATRVTLAGSQPPSPLSSSLARQRQRSASTRGSGSSGSGSGGTAVHITATRPTASSLLPSPIGSRRAVALSSNNSPLSRPGRGQPLRATSLSSQPISNHTPSNTEVSSPVSHPSGASTRTPTHGRRALPAAAQHHSPNQSPSTPSPILALRRRSPQVPSLGAPHSHTNATAGTPPTRLNLGSTPPASASAATSTSTSSPPTSHPSTPLSSSSPNARRRVVGTGTATRSSRASSSTTADVAAITGGSVTPLRRQTAAAARYSNGIARLERQYSRERLNSASNRAATPSSASNTLTAVPNPTVSSASTSSQLTNHTRTSTSSSSSFAPSLSFHRPDHATNAYSSFPAASLSSSSIASSPSSPSSNATPMLRVSSSVLGGATNPTVPSSRSTYTSHASASAYDWSSPMHRTERNIESDESSEDDNESTYAVLSSPAHQRAQQIRQEWNAATSISPNHQHQHSSLFPHSSAQRTQPRPSTSMSSHGADLSFLPTPSSSSSFYLNRGAQLASLARQAGHHAHRPAAGGGDASLLDSSASSLSSADSAFAPSSPLRSFHRGGVDGELDVEALLARQDEERMYNQIGIASDSDLEQALASDEEDAHEHEHEYEYERDHWDGEIDSSRHHHHRPDIVVSVSSRISVEPIHAHANRRMAAVNARIDRLQRALDTEISEMRADRQRRLAEAEARRRQREEREQQRREARERMWRQQYDGMDEDDQVENGMDSDDGELEGLHDAPSLDDLAASGDGVVDDMSDDGYAPAVSNSYHQRSSLPPPRVSQRVEVSFSPYIPAAERMQRGEIQWHSSDDDEVEVEMEEELDQHHPLQRALDEHERGRYQHVPPEVYAAADPRSHAASSSSASSSSTVQFGSLGVSVERQAALRAQMSFLSTLFDNVRAYQTTLVESLHRVGYVDDSGVGGLSGLHAGLVHMLIESAWAAAARNASFNEAMDAPGPTLPPGHAQRVAELKSYARVTGAEDCCSICLDAMAAGSECTDLNMCKHTFHTTCIKQWLEKANTCPLCKGEAIPVPAEVQVE